jgi:nitrogen fixation/metabolism regulation signal transduction histidine kinase
LSRHFSYLPNGTVEDWFNIEVVRDRVLKAAEALAEVRAAANHTSIKDELFAISGELMRQAEEYQQQQQREATRH